MFLRAVLVSCRPLFLVLKIRPSMHAKQFSVFSEGHLAAKLSFSRYPNAVLMAVSLMVFDVEKIAKFAER